MPLRDDDGPRDDRWRRVAPGEALEGAVIVGFADLEDWGDGLDGIEPARLGLLIEADVALDALDGWLDRAGLISVAFPGFADGRGFSIARALRGRGFAGRLRASGPLIADQYAYLRACGFDEVETPDALANRQPEAQWAEISEAARLRYQRGYPGARNILDARREARS